jgi:hypothetical protein
VHLNLGPGSIEWFAIPIPPEATYLEMVTRMQCIQQWIAEMRTGNTSFSLTGSARGREVMRRVRVLYGDLIHCTQSRLHLTSPLLTPLTRRHAASR